MVLHVEKTLETTIQKMLPKSVAEFRYSQAIFLRFTVILFHSNWDEKSNEQKVTSNEQRAKSSVSSGNEKYFCFLFIANHSLLKGMPNAVDSYKNDFFTCYSCSDFSSMVALVVEKKLYSLFSMQRFTLNNCDVSKIKRSVHDTITFIFEVLSENFISFVRMRLFLKIKIIVNLRVTCFFQKFGCLYMRK